ncbi:MAG: hypothetical protein ISS59_06335 [Desulfobacteraceae bacterium]|nr:hypothetical protein [Desulfobacteraceae bacterium]
MLIIAERINASPKCIAQAISSKHTKFIQSEAKAQPLAGADQIDVNAGIFKGKKQIGSNGASRRFKRSRRFLSPSTARTPKS